MFSAKSIIAALKANTELLCEGIDTLGCPSPIPRDNCTSNPDSCNLGRDQKCKQSISIHKDLKKLAVLHFKYMVSPQNHDGFIRKDDMALNHLIDHKFIDATLLISA